MDEPLEFYVDVLRNSNVTTVGVFTPISRSRVDWGFQTAYGGKGSKLQTILLLTNRPPLVVTAAILVRIHATFLIKFANRYALP